MLLTRRNKVGGRELTKFWKSEEDYRTGRWGIKIGYCEGCNEPILIPRFEADFILARLHFSLEEYEEIMRSLSYAQENTL